MKRKFHKEHAVETVAAIFIFGYCKCCKAFSNQNFFLGVLCYLVMVILACITIHELFDLIKMIRSKFKK